MRLRDQISRDLMSAMKLKDSGRLSVLRMMKAAIKNKEVEICKELEDAQVLQVLMTMIRQHKDSIEQYARGGRTDLSEKEAAEIEVIEHYMPAAVTEEEIRSVIETVIAETGAKTVKDMGMVMKACMAHFAGRPLDGRKVSELVKIKLQ